MRLLDSELNDLINSSIINSPKEAELFLNSHIEPIPTGAPFISSLESQLRKDLWYDRDGIAVFSKIAKSNPQNYIEHYISSPGDVTTLPWDAAEKISNNFGFNTVKQQWMYQQRQHRIENRIVSIAQPHVRPIVLSQRLRPLNRWQRHWCDPQFVLRVA